jgi:hypothetical protein
MAAQFASNTHISVEQSVHNEIGQALRSILDSSAFATPLNQVDSRVLNFVALKKKSADNMYTRPSNLPNRVYEAVAGRLFPRALRLHLYNKHLKSTREANVAGGQEVSKRCE